MGGRDMKNEWDEAFGLRHDKTPEYFDRPFVKILFPLGGFLVGAISLLTSSSNLPIWALGVLVCFVAICALVLLWPPLDWCLTRLKQWRRRNRAARLFYA